jgi:hypothetical protein
VTSISCSTFAESPTYVIVSPSEGKSESGDHLFFNWDFAEGAAGLGVGVGRAEGEAKSGACSCSVRRSANIWVGCQREESALRTGTGEYFASSYGSLVVRVSTKKRRRVPRKKKTSISSCAPTLAKIP